MANLSDIDLSSVEAEAPRGALPPGEYAAIIIESSEKEPRNGGAAYLELVLQIQEPGFSGRRVWDRLHLRHATTTAANIARQRLKAIAEALGLARLADSTQLHNRPLMVTLEVREYNGQQQNEVKGYSPKRATAAPVTQKPAQPAGGLVNPFG
jgi:hypothetical protein